MCSSQVMSWLKTHTKRFFSFFIFVYGYVKDCPFSFFIYRKTIGRNQAFIVGWDELWLFGTQKPGHILYRCGSHIKGRKHNSPIYSIFDTQSPEGCMSLYCTYIWLPSTKFFQTWQIIIFKYVQS